MPKKADVKKHRTARMAISKAEREKLKCAIGKLETSRMAEFAASAKEAFEELVLHRQQNFHDEELEALRRHQVAIGMEYCNVSGIFIRVAFNSDTVTKTELHKCPILEKMTEFEQYHKRLTVEAYNDGTGAAWMVQLFSKFACHEDHPGLVISPAAFGKAAAPIFSSMDEFAESPEAAFFVACIKYHELAKNTREAFNMMLDNTYSLDKLKEWWPEAIAILERTDVLVEDEDEMDNLVEQLKAARDLVSTSVVLPIDTTSCGYRR